MSSEMDNDAIQLYPPFRHAAQQFLQAGFVDGQVVPHGWFYEQFGLEMPSPSMPIEKADKIRFQFLSQMTAFRDVMLNEHMRALRNHIGEGYSVVPAQEQTAWALKEKEKELRRTAVDLVRLVNGVRLSDLTAAQRAENADARVKAAAIKHMLSPKGLRAACTDEQKIIG